MDLTLVQMAINVFLTAINVHLSQFSQIGLTKAEY